VAVEFCCCPDAPSDQDQLKARGWWPMRSNFVAALSLEVFNVVFPPEPAAESESESESEESSGSDASGSSGSVNASGSAE
jgi:hypothetical protein